MLNVDFRVKKNVLGMHIRFQMIDARLICQKTLIKLQIYIIIIQGGVVKICCTFLISGVTATVFY